MWSHHVRGMSHDGRSRVQVLCPATLHKHLKHNTTQSPVSAQLRQHRVECRYARAPHALDSVAAGTTTQRLSPPRPLSLFPLPCPCPCHHHFPPQTKPSCANGKQCPTKQQRTVRRGAVAEEQDRVVKVGRGRRAVGLVVHTLTVVSERLKLCGAPSKSKPQ